MTESTRHPRSGEALPTVFVVEDDVSVRESLGRLIREEGWIPQLFGTAREFLDHPIGDTPRCLLLDVSLPDLNGLDLQQRLSHGEKMPIIFVTGATNVPTTVRAMKAGAFEFLSKPFDTEVLASAVRQALHCSSAALQREAELCALEQVHALLTAREREVMRLVVTGRLNKQIASELGISEFTVKSHRGKVMQKMRAESVAALVKIDAKLSHAAPAQRTGDQRPPALDQPTEVSHPRWRAI